MGRCPHRRHATGPSRPDRPFPRRGGAGPSRPGGPFPVPVAWRRLGLGLGDRRREVARVAAEAGLPLADGRREALAESLPSWPPFPEVPAALEALRARGWRLGILSNTDPDLLAASVDNIGVPVDVSVTAAEAGSYKPAHG